MTTTDHDHATVGEAGECPQCRARNIALCGDDPFGFLLLFAQPGATEAQAVAAVRTAGPDMAVETAWATGCNAGVGYGVAEIGPVDPDHLAELGVPWFELVTGPAATLALARITSPAGVAAVDAFRAALRGEGGCSCHECGQPLNVSPN